MPATPATLFGTEMTTLTGNTGGAIQSLISPMLDGGRERVFIANLALAAQASGSVIGLARIPVPFNLVGIMALTDTSLSTAQFALGNAGNGNSAKYKAAGTLTTTDTPTWYGLTASMGVPQFSGFDCVSGLASAYTTGGNGGGLYEDIIMTTSVASLPGSGNLRLFFHFVID